MLVKFDKLDRYETPLFYVCNPGCELVSGALTNVMGVLSDTSDEEIIFNFNAKSELNLRVYKRKMEDSVQNRHFATLFNALEARRMIYVEDIGFFIIDNVTEGYDNYVTYKDVNASSCETEIENKQIPYFADGTYPFSTQGTTEGMLEKMVSALPLWQVDHVDNAVATRYRTFEDIDESTNIYSFMLKNMQDAYECIFVFDIKNRLINVYNRDTYIVKTDIHLTKDDLIQSVKVDESSDDLYTAITVSGDEDSLTIAAVNPLGTRTIYNFDYYLNWMSAGLKSAVIDWRTKVEGYADTYYNDSISYYDYLTQVSNYNAEIDRLDIVIDMYKRCRDNIVAEASTRSIPSYNSVIVSNNGTPIPTTGEIADLKTSISGLITTAQTARSAAVTSRNTAQTNANSVNQSMQAIRDDVSFSNTGNFTSDQLAELMHYIYEGSYQDEYITVTDTMTQSQKLTQMKTLYDRAVTQLDKLAEPTYKFTVDVENFLFQSQFAYAASKLETGCIINVELSTNDIAELFLSSIQLNWFDHQLSLTFGNRYNKFDPGEMFDSVLGNVKRSANAINYIKELISPIASGELNEMQMAIDNSRNLTKDMAMTATDNEVQIDDTGYLGRKLLDNGEYDDEQIKIVNNSIVFTDDAWDTAKTAVGKIVLSNGTTVYGVNAEVLIGDLIIGDRLHIGYYDSGADVYRGLGDAIGSRNLAIDSNQTRIVDSGFSSSYSSETKTLTVNTSVLSASGDGTIVIQKADCLDVTETQNADDTYDIDLGYIYASPSTITYDLSDILRYVSQGNTFTLSFYAGATAAATVSAALYSGSTIIGSWSSSVSVDTSGSKRYTIENLSAPDVSAVNKLKIKVTCSSGYAFIRKVKLEFGVVATSWTLAPEDDEKEIKEIRTLIHDQGSSLDVVQNQISSKVWETDINAAAREINGVISGIDVRVTKNESSITQTARSIESKVSYSDYTGNRIASIINQTATTVTIDAQKINLTGAVTISTFGSDVNAKLDNMIAATTTAQTTADSKAKTFRQASAPTSGMSSGDIWYDSDDGNKAYRYNGSSWISVQDSQIEANHAALVRWASDNNLTSINGSMITTGTILTERIKLYGKMNVYQSASSNTLGGYIGYMAGATSSGTSTNGIALMSPTASNGTYNYAIATDAGVRMTNVYQGGTYTSFDISGGAGEFLRNGKTYIQFLVPPSSTTGTAGCIFLNNSSEQNMVTLRANDTDGGIITVYSPDTISNSISVRSITNSNNTVAAMGTNSNGVGFITVRNASGSNRVAIASNTTDGGVIRLYNAGGTASSVVTHAWLNRATYDSGWKNFTYSDAFRNYNSSSDVLQYRRLGDIVELVGAAQPTATITAGNSATIGTLPEGYRPAATFRCMCQGSGKNTWYLSITTGGVCTFARYGTDVNADASDAVWLPMHATFVASSTLPSS